MCYDSYIGSTEILDPGMFRLLETDNRLILPYLINIRVLIRRADVLHSCALSRLGVKLDATPGRLNQVVISSYRPESLTVNALKFAAQTIDIYLLWQSLFQYKSLMSV